MGWLSPWKSGEESKDAVPVGAAPPAEPFPVPGSPYHRPAEPIGAAGPSAAVDIASPAPLVPSGGDNGPIEVISPNPVAGVASFDSPQVASPVGPLSAVVADRDDDVPARLDALAGEQAALRELFHARLRNDEVQNRSLDRLLAELGDYKADFIRRRMLPLLREVIDCHDLAHREARRLSASAVSPPEAESTRKSLEVLAQMLRDLLARHDVEAYESDGTDFDPKTQQCTRTVPTHDPALDKRIAENIVPGFRTEGALVRRELVAVYRYVATSEGGEPRGEV
jgi:molecular chaperone GrpE (heat shock protein)